MQSFPRATAVIERDIAAGHALGAQLYVTRGERTLIDEAFGEAAPGVALDSDMPMLWMSCSKPITAAAVAQQWEEGRIDLDAPVADTIPDFAAGGKDAVTVRHLLTHTGGPRKASFHFPDDDWDAIIARICETPLDENIVPGHTAAYNATVTWYVLGELVRRAADEPFPAYVRQNIFEPLGMNDCWLCMPADVYDAVADGIVPMWDTRFDEPRPTVYTRTQRLTSCNPGGGAVGPARELGRFYRALLNGGELDRVRIVEPETVELFTSRQREGLMDATFRQTVDWGLGFLLDSKRYGKRVIPYGFGEHASDDAFGHGGSQSSLSFADPRNQLVVVFIFNGMPGEATHQKRSHELATAVYEDLGL